MAVGITLCGGLLVSVVLAVRWRRSGIPLARAVTGAVNLFCGVVTVTLGTLHAAAVAGVRIAAWNGGKGFDWDFRLYSLFLLSGVLIGAGLKCLWHTGEIARGQPAARRSALRASLILLATNLPLSPIQGLAAGLAALSLTNVLILLAMRSRFPG
jgi:hypothetical protein